MAIGADASASTSATVARFAFGSMTVRAPIACIRGCSARSRRSITFFRSGLHVAELEVADDVDTQRDVARLPGSEQLGGQSRGQPARRFVEREPSLLGSLLDRLQELEPLGRTPLFGDRQRDHVRHRGGDAVTGDVVEESHQTAPGAHRTALR